MIRPEKEKSFKVYVEQDRKPLTEEDEGDDIKIAFDGRTYILIEKPRMYFAGEEYRGWVSYTEIDYDFKQFCCIYIHLCFIV